MKLYEIMKKQTVTEIMSLRTELTALEERKSTDSETGEILKYLRVSAEISKKQGVWSRMQFDVKIPEGRIKVDPALLESGEAEYEVFFEKLEITFIDSKGNVYFRAENYSVEEIVEEV